MYKRKDGLFEKTMTLNGKRKTFRGRTQKDVMLKIASYHEAVERGRTFEAVAEEWSEQHFKTLSPNTLKGYSAAYKRAVGHFGSGHIKEIAPADIQRYVNEFAALGYARKTVSNHLLVLNLIFQSAFVAGDVPSVPTQHIKIPKNLKKSTRELPSAAEIEKIKNSVDCTFGLFAYFLLYTGLRVGEALALEWSDIDFDKNSLCVNKSVYHLNNKAHVKEPKTEAGKREIVLMQRLRDRLKKGSGVLFSEDGTHLKGLRFRRLWELYKRESGVTITPHQLRHAFATICFEAGLDEKDAQELLGHADISTTRNIYTHISESRKQKTAKLLDEYSGSF